MPASPRISTSFEGPSATPFHASSRDAHSLRRPISGWVAEAVRGAPVGAGRVGRRGSVARRRRIECQESFVRRARLRVGFDAELAAEVRHGCVVRLQPRRPIAGRGSDPHQRPVGGLLDRVELDQPAQELHRAAILAPLLEVRDEPLRGLELEPLEPLAVGLDPVVVAGRQERSVVQPQRLLEGRGVARAPALDGRLEICDVEAERLIGSPLDGPALEHDEAVGIGQRPAQQVQLPAEVGQRLGVARLGPQRERELIARDGSIAVHQQIGDERLEPGRADALDPSSADAQLEMAEQLDRESLAHVPVVPLVRRPSAPRSAAGSSSVWNTTQ